MQRQAEIGLIAVCGLALLTLLLKNLSYPLMWQDEAETAVFATRILDYGYPKVHGDRNVVYEFGSSITHGIDERTDAYIGTTWGHFYYAVPGVLAAAATDDLYAKTWRIRLPFALMGALGIGLGALAVTPIFRGRPARARRFVICFLILSCGSISLLLHIREARYYALLIALIGAIGWVHFHHVVFETLAYRRYAFALAVLMVLLFNVFYSAFFIVGLLLTVEALWRTHTAGFTVKRAVASLAPLAAAGVCVVPLLIYFETFSIASEFSAHVGFTAAGYLANLESLFVHLLRHEVLAAALLLRMVVRLSDAISEPTLESWEVQSRRVVSHLAGFVLGYALLSCVNPLVYERYFIVLSTPLVVMFLLDAICSLARVRAHDPAGTGPGHLLAIAAMVALIAATGLVRAADVRGRLHEIAEAYRGPLDYVIPWIQAQYPNPEELVIATNYENHPYMYYLGSHTIVGLSRNNIRRDRLLEPDLVIPRRRWRSSLGDAMAFVRQAPYRSKVFDVRDLHYNNVPALSRSPSTPDPHRFVTALAERDDQRLEVYVRVDSEPAR